MVNHPSDYPWSSYRHNAMGEEDGLITHHELYRQLGGSCDERLKAYRQLFRTRIQEQTLKDIREATNKAWVLGNDRFRTKVERLIARKTVPSSRGGDHKSKNFRDSKINRD